MVIENLTSQVGLIPQQYVVTTVAFLAVITVNSLIKNGFKAYVKVFIYAILTGFTLFYYSGLDVISKVFAVLCLLVGAFLTVYTQTYERVKYGGGGLTSLIDTFVFSIYFVFISTELFIFIMAWLFAEIIGFFNIVYEVERRTLVAGLRYLLISMIPSDIALLTMLGVVAGKLSLGEAFLTPVNGLNKILTDVNPAFYTLILLGFLGKAAVAPFHFWLPDAHSLAPAPASAVLSGVMVKMGIYGIFRVIPSVPSTDYTLYLLTFLSSITVIYSGLQALTQTDIKRVLAYSTIENTGIIALALTTYRLFNLDVLLTGALLYSLAHGIFKAALFMNSGVVEVLTHTRELPKLGYLGRVAPKPTYSALISTMSLIGVPPSLGFVGKVLVFTGFTEAILNSPPVGVLLVSVLAVGVALSAAYGSRYMLTYWGAIKVKPPSEVRSVPQLESSDFTMSLMNVVATFPTLIVLGLHALGSTLTASLLVLSTLALAVMWYAYTYVKNISSKPLWLGGSV